MPDLTPDEYDRCPHCDAILYDPPNCCEAMVEEWGVETAERDWLAKLLPQTDYDYSLWED